VAIREKLAFRQVDIRGIWKRLRAATYEVSLKKRRRLGARSVGRKRELTIHSFWIRK